ncbi:type I restriction endonuclease [Photorhabdus khanii]|uniref:Type I restriction endonuclease subunit R n=1 Tax=Photorhabdus khanii subsp. guanajuatensis TaxID=2100166 RepID=A0A4R4JIT2_9GAMM|nr:type I restriction endonuclease [Photorhabdus khanii]TDB54197.1 type I restriction endonuclease subunit R [Photorhabdus khanii subsp. guanajuatensis]
MENFKIKIKHHVNHVNNVGQHCITEETTKQALILPFLDILGFSPYDPQKVKAEYGADFPGVKANERVDYALFCQSVPVMFIEAKGYSEKLDNHCPQLSRYFNSTPEVTISAITNGIEWRFFTDLKQKNVMDPTPFLRIKMDEVSDADVSQLYRFRHDKFKPEALRTLAEESVYLSTFTKTISTSLRDVDSEFVRYVASRSNVERQLNQRFIESITPLVKQAVEKSVSAMVVSGLSNKHVPIDGTPDEIESQESLQELEEIADPDNPNIVTTKNELTLYEKAKSIVGDSVDLQYKDTESYFGILYQGKSNRWIIRYFDKKNKPYILIPIEITDILTNEVNRAGLSVNNSRIFIESPEDILRITGIILDAFEFVKNDNNFRKKAQ